MPRVFDNFAARKCRRAGMRFQLRQLATAVRPTPKALAALAVPPRAAMKSRTFMAAIIIMRWRASSHLTSPRRVK